MFSGFPRDLFHSFFQSSPAGISEVSRSFQEAGLFLAGSRDVFWGVTPRVLPSFFEECPRVKLFPREFPDFLFPFHLAVFPGRAFPREFSGTVYRD